MSRERVYEVQVVGISTVSWAHVETTSRKRSALVAARRAARSTLSRIRRGVCSPVFGEPQFRVVLRTEETVWATSPLSPVSRATSRLGSSSRRKAEVGLCTCRRTTKNKQSLKLGRYVVQDDYPGSRLQFRVYEDGVPLARRHGAYWGYRRFGSLSSAKAWVEERSLSSERVGGWLLVERLAEHPANSRGTSE